MIEWPLTSATVRCGATTAVAALPLASTVNTGTSPLWPSPLGPRCLPVLAGSSGHSAHCRVHNLDWHGHGTVSYTHLRAHETRHDLVCRLLLEKKKKQQINR